MKEFFGYDMTIVILNTEQMWLSSDDLHKTNKQK